MSRETVDRWCERGILALVLAILVIGPLATGAVRPISFVVLQALTLGVMALWGARLWVSPRPQFLWPPICWAVAAFTALTIVRYFTADVEYVARQEMIRILVYTFLFLAVLNNLYRQESTQIISCTLLVLAMGIASYAGYQFLTHSDRVWFYHVPANFGASGTYISRNHLGGFLEMILPLGLAYALTSRLKPLVKIFLGYASLVVLAGIVVTVSRGTYISTVLALTVFFAAMLFHRKHRMPALLLLGLVLVGGLYFLPINFAVRTRFKLLVGEMGRVEMDTRIMLWRAAVQVWEQAVWWGVGPGQYDYRFRQFRPPAVQMRPGWAHNDYLNSLAEWGVVGTAIIASAWVLLGLGVRKTWPFVGSAPADLGGGRGSNKYALVLGVSLGLFAILVHSAVDFNMHIPANAILAITLMAMLTSCLRFATDRYWVSANAAGKVIASLILLGGLFYLGQQGVRRARESVWLIRAERASAFSPAQIACLQQAFAAEPMNADTACAIGEAYRVQSSEGGDNYAQLAEKAMEWFDRSTKLNPWGGYARLSPWAAYGWCLDWLGKTDQSLEYYRRADELDPNNYFLIANIGLHYVQSRDYAAARTLFERSLHLQGKENSISTSYLKIVNDRLREAATNEISAKLSYPSQ